MKKLGIIFLVFFVFIALSYPPPVSAQVIDPQYIFVRKDPMTCNPSDCSFLWNMDDPNKINLEAINDIFNKIGTHGNSNNTRKIGIAVQFLYYEYDFNKLKQSLDALLVYAKVHTVPVFIVLEGFQWWDNRSNLWNWWDPTAPGYNPDNKNNVEWTCENATCAIKKSWRNWGSEFDVKPHPNIASRAFIDDNKQKLSELLPKIVQWYGELPSDKKWLLGGVALGTEVDMGANYYYYPNGVNPNASNPGPGIAGSVQLGYAAVKTLKLSGGITQANLNEAIRRYLNELDKFAFDAGIPRNKIFNHIGGSDLSPNPTPAGLIFPSTDAAVTAYGSPGWSFYGGVTDNPQNFSGISSALTKVGNNQWASPEWLSFGGNYDEWLRALRNSLNYRNNRFINIANWEGIRDKQYVLEALKTVLNESPSCWVTTPYMQSVTVSGNTATLTWQKGTNNDAVYLNVSNVEGFTETGTLQSVNITNDVVTNKNSYTINNLGSNKYYWELIADGCTNQRKISDGSFVIAKPGDLNGDGHVNIFDYNILVANFDHPYTIFDYTTLVANFGK